MLRPTIELECTAVEPLYGPWDPPRLVRALVGFGEGANRIGDGTGVVRLDAVVAADCVTLRFSSGVPRGDPRPITADAGFAFFHARQYVLAAGGTVECDRGDRYLAITVTLPRAARGSEDTAE
jgi:hypothetical protein